MMLAVKNRIVIKKHSSGLNNPAYGEYASARKSAQTQ